MKGKICPDQKRDFFNKRLPAGPRLCRVETIGPKWVGSVPKIDFVFMPCYHCDRPWCVAACPTEAMQKRAKDGIVFVDHDLCVGCKACMKACPWGAPQWDPEKGKVVKCDYCMDRVDQGLEPACVAKCVTKCLHFGKPAEMIDAIAFLRDVTRGNRHSPGQKWRS